MLSDFSELTTRDTSTLAWKLIETCIAQWSQVMHGLGCIHSVLNARLSDAHEYIDDNILSGDKAAYCRNMLSAVRNDNITLSLRA